MNIEQEREKLILFTKIGAIVLTSFALLATSFFVYPENRAVFNESLLHEKELPIYCVEKEKPQISISFDAAWGNDDTASLLATLKKHKVKATFFMTGGWIEKYPDDVKAIAAGGHDLGNHSENHKQMSQLSAAQCKEEIMKPHEKVKKLTGKDMILFRPPYGDYNDTLIRVCRENKYYPIQLGCGFPRLERLRCRHHHTPRHRTQTSWQRFDYSLPQWRKTHRRSAG